MKGQDTKGKNPLFQVAKMAEKLDVSQVLPDAQKEEGQQVSPDRAELDQAGKEVKKEIEFGISVVGKLHQASGEKKPSNKAVKSEAPISSDTEKGTQGETKRQAPQDTGKKEKKKPEQDRAGDPSELKKSRGEKPLAQVDHLFPYGGLPPIEAEPKAQDASSSQARDPFYHPTIKMVERPAQDPVGDRVSMGREIRTKPGRDNGELRLGETRESKIRETGKGGLIREQEIRQRPLEREPISGENLPFCLDKPQATRNAQWEGAPERIPTVDAMEPASPMPLHTKEMLSQKAKSPGTVSPTERKETASEEDAFWYDPPTSFKEQAPPPGPASAVPAEQMPAPSKERRDTTLEYRGDLAKGGLEDRGENTWGNRQEAVQNEGREVKERPSAWHEVRLRGQTTAGEDRDLRLKNQEISMPNRSAKLVEVGERTDTAATVARQVNTEVALETAAGGAGEGAAASASSGAGGAAGVAIMVAKRAQEEITRTLAAVSGDVSSPTGNDQSGTGKMIFVVGGLLGGVILFLFPLLNIFLYLSLFSGVGNKNLSEHVKAWMPQISAACQKYEIPEYVPLVAAIMMQESGGDAELVHGDVMQCAEGMGHPVGTPVDPETSIDFGVKIIASYLKEVGVSGPSDMDRLKLAVQAYNFGGGYLPYAMSRDGKYTKENAIAYAEKMAVEMGWSSYGDTEYVDHVLRYYTTSVGSGTGDPSTLFPSLSYPMEDYTWDTYSDHEGIDMACEVGTPVYASGTGTVWYAYGSWTPADGIDGMMSYGNGVCISHDNGLETRYGHMSSIVVAPGQQILQGQLIGYTGNTGNSTGPHMHFSIYVNGSTGGRGYDNYAARAFGKYAEVQ